ncbi:helix-turn-helix transcriptional regulator [Peptococcaceae bacterium 1198_IL3148]
MSEQTMGDRIKQLRESKKWSQEKLAAESGTSKTYIYLLETNQRQKDTSATKLNAIADALNTTVDYLLTGKELLDITKIDPELQNIYIELLESGELPYYRKSKDIDEEGLKSILEFIRFIKLRTHQKENSR